MINEVKEPEIDKKLLDIRFNANKFNQKELIDTWLEIIDGIINYAEKNKIYDLEELDKEQIISDFMINIFGDFENEIYNLDKEDYDLNVTNKYLDKIVNTLKLSDNLYENILRCKTFNLFRLGEYAQGEEVMLALIKEKNNSIYPYVELVDCYQMIKDFDKARYYYDLGLKQTGLEDMGVLEERKDYFE